MKEIWEGMKEKRKKERKSEKEEGRKIDGRTDRQTVAKSDECRKK